MGLYTLRIIGTPTPGRVCEPCDVSFLNKLGVSISIHKSIISRNGCLEFAKRFWAKNLTKDLSPISLKAILNSVTLIGLVQLIGKYQCYLAFQLLSTYSIRLLYKIQKT